jgi:hypothetical protein
MKYNKKQASEPRCKKKAASSKAAAHDDLTQLSGTPHRDLPLDGG